MTPRLVEARYVDGYRVWLRFADGVQGNVDLRGELWGGVFEPLLDLRAFSRLALHPELHTVTWDNGADMAPEFLYHLLGETVAQP